jgi:undecaprenyl-diphosphatase
MVGSMTDVNIIWQFFSIFGDLQYWIGLVVGAVLIYIVLRRKSKNRVAWVIFSLIPATIIATAVSISIKFWLKIPRPCIDLAGCPAMYSFPSNHAAAIFAFATVMSLNIKSWKVWVGASALAVFVSMSRVALGVHMPIDIVGGAIIGIASGVIMQMTYKKLYKLWVSKSPKGSLSRFLGVK